MRNKIPLITNKDKVIEYMSEYSLEERLKYWSNNRNIFKEIPTNQDIHIHNVCKDTKKRELN